jgi:hypothetical protein
LKPSNLPRLAFLCLTPFATQFARARSDVAGPTAAGSDRPFTEFARGTWTVQTYGGYLNELGPHDQEAGFAAFGGSYCFRDNMSLGLEVVGYGITQPGPDAVSGGPQIVFRHHLFNTRDTSFFLDLTAAFAEASERVPAEGTRFNFIEQFGAGLTRDLGDNAHLLAGVRYYHLSNASLEGHDRNPSNNGVVVYVGLLFTL